MVCLFTFRGANPVPRTGSFAVGRMTAGQRFPVREDHVLAYRE